MPHPRAAVNSANASRQVDCFWTAERTAQLRSALGKGLSASATAAEIGGGCSRNMVIGKARRLRLDFIGWRETLARNEARRNDAAARDAKVRERRAARIREQIENLKSKLRDLESAE